MDQQKTQLFYCCSNHFCGKMFCLWRCYPVMALVYLLISRSLPSNVSTLYNTNSFTCFDAKKLFCKIWHIPLIMRHSVQKQTCVYIYVWWPTNVCQQVAEYKCLVQKGNMERLGHMHLKENIQCAHTFIDANTCAKDVIGTSTLATKTQ
jgi:hypothetical protein